MRHVDLAIIGTGSGNSILDERFDDLDVALVEHGVFGGTCLNVGCIPTKMYVYAADVAEQIHRAPTYGVDATLEKVGWTDIRDRIFGRIDPISAAGERYRVADCRNVTVYSGHARFTGERRLEIDGQDALTADRIVVAAGSRPLIPPEVCRSTTPFHTSDDIMRIDAVPAHLVILGGGYIAAEFAHVFSALGARVSVVARGNGLLRYHDELVSQRFTELARQRWDVHLGRVPELVESNASEVRLRLPGATTLTGDALLVAVGRIPNGDLLDVAAGGIATHPDGRVAVDEFQRTSAEGVWALGDVSSPFQLKHVANHEATVVQHNLLYPDELRATDHRFVPSAVFTSPQIATVGLTERECRARNLDYVAAVQEYGGIAYGWAMEDTTGFCKLLAERGTGRLLGAHLMGPQASTLVQPLIQAMSFGLSAREMARGQYWIHPALPEVVENALLALDV